MPEMSDAKPKDEEAKKKEIEAKFKNLFHSEPLFASMRVLKDSSISQSWQNATLRSLSR